MEIHHSLGYILNISARLIKRELDLQLKEYGITTSQWAVLKLLSSENSLTQAEITDKLNSDRATCGTVIDKLVSKGFLQREIYANDRRCYHVKLTPLAINIIDEITLVAKNVNLSAIKGLSDSDIDTLTRCLNTIIANLDK